jgi:hypothetical protein
MAGVELTLLVTLPDGTQQTYPLTPTGENGQTSVSVSITNASIGTVIPYEVCVVGVPDPPDCVKENFVIWDNP